MTLNGVMAVTSRYFNEFGKSALQKTVYGGIYEKVLYFLVRVQCRRKESSRSLSHLLMSFLLTSSTGHQQAAQRNKITGPRSIRAINRLMKGS